MLSEYFENKPLRFISSSWGWWWWWWFMSMALTGEDFKERSWCAVLASLEELCYCIGEVSEVERDEEAWWKLKVTPICSCKFPGLTETGRTRIKLSFGWSSHTRNMCTLTGGSWLGYIDHRQLITAMEAIWYDNLTEYDGATEYDSNDRQLLLSSLEPDPPRHPLKFGCSLTEITSYSRFCAKQIRVWFETVHWVIFSYQASARDNF